MYCPNCGKQLNNNGNNCEACGWTIEANQDKAKDALREEINFGQKDNSNKSRLSDNSSTFFTKNTNKKVYGKAIPVFIVLGLVFALIIGVVVHINSDGYKIKKATDYILLGDYTEGTNIIQDIYTPQAVAIKKFVDVEIAKKEFTNYCEENNKIEVSNAYWDFNGALNEFSDDNSFYYLNEELLKNYNCYKNAFEYVSKYIDSDERQLSSSLYQVQSVMMNEVEQNKSLKGEKYFTLADLQERVNTSKKALKELEDIEFPIIEIKDTNVITYCRTETNSDENGNKTVICVSDYLSDMFDTLYRECESEINSSQEEINDALEKFELNSDLYMTKPDATYRSYVGSSLNRIDDYDDIANNRNTIINLLRRDMLYYLITGEIII